MVTLSILLVTPCRRDIVALQHYYTRTVYAVPLILLLLLLCERALAYYIYTSFQCASIPGVVEAASGAFVVVKWKSFHGKFNKN